LAFHPYPQVIPAVFNPHGFGPPPPVTAASTCSRVDRHGFGSTTTYVRPVQTRFRSGSGPEGLNLHVISNSPDHNAKGTQSGPCGPSYSLSAHGFRIYFTRHLACFSPFPHGTRALSVIEEYLGLEGGPPRFAQHSTCAALLGIPLGVVRNRLPGYHRLWRAVPGRFTLASYSHVVVPQPRGSKLPWFGLFRVRSPLLTESRLISIPAGTEMFQFPALAPLRVTALSRGRVSPFGHPEITARVQLPQAYRSLPRPSSPLDAKASTVCLIAFDLTTC
jgi:hypothetical protein